MSAPSGNDAGFVAGVAVGFLASVVTAAVVLLVRREAIKASLARNIEAVIDSELRAMSRADDSQSRLIATAVLQLPFYETLRGRIAREVIVNGVFDGVGL